MATRAGASRRSLFPSNSQAHKQGTEARYPEMSREGRGTAPLRAVAYACEQASDPRLPSCLVGFFIRSLSEERDAC
eukprot:scaffold10036_cov75-Phaeocystis_antarctica.AAC.3